MPRKPHKLERIADAVTSEPWAILPAKLEAICDFFDQRLEGNFLSDDEIRAAVGEQDEEEDPNVTTVEGVRIINIRGTITPKATLLSKFSGGASCDAIAHQVQKAVADDQVKAILLRIDSPGGSVHGTSEVARQVFEARDKKPIHAWVDHGYCASGAYWIATACSRVYATEGSEVGSIGVLMIHREMVKAAENAGVKYTVLRSVENKAIGQSVETLDNEKRAVMMARIEDWHGKFTEAVARHRGTTEARVSSEFGRGKTFLASEATDLGMIDGVKSFSQVFESLRATSGGSSVVSTPKEINVDQRLKMALFVHGIIPSADTTDDNAEMALGSFLRGRGVERPNDLDALIELVSSKPKTAVTTQQPPTGSASSSGQATGNPGPSAAEAAAEAVRAENQRWAQLGARGRLLGVSAEEVLAAQEGGLSLEAAVLKWTENLEANHGAVDASGVRATGSAFDAFVEGAEDAILATLRQSDPSEKPSEYAKEFQHLSMYEIAQRGLSLANVRVGSGMNREDVCEQFLKLSGTSNTPMASGGGSPTYGPGHYPDLMSNVANRILNRGQQLAPATYKEWTSAIPSVPDFRARTIINTGAFGLFSHILDGKEIPESEFGTERNFVQVDRFGDKVKLTPVMMANDDLDAWSEALKGLGSGAMSTINAAAISLLYSTSPLPDGNALFDASNHLNVVSGGGAPSITQSDKMRKLHRSQKEVSNRLRISVAPAIALVPTKHETAAEQLFVPSLKETPEQAANSNPFRGKIKPICDGMLDDYSADKWFTFADPMAYRGIVVMHQTGYENGRRRRYWQEETQCLIQEYEIRFAVGVADYRMMVQNPGT